ncbi:MAG: hypothetical protein WCA84_04120 [Ignavibacteriaceae bacterium]
MRILILIPIFMIFLIGCSSTYKISDFSSPEKFYKDFNKSADGKILKITLHDDSSFIATQGANVSNDSLTYHTMVQKEEAINKADIKDIKYYGTDMTNLSATILLNNGESATAKNITLSPDSSINAVLFESRTERLPILKIKEVSYVNHSTGTLMGVLLGIPVGLLTELIIRPAFFENSKGNSVSNSSNTILNVISILCPVVGGIIWGEKGYKYTYQFNP